MKFDNADHELAVFKDIFYADIEKGWNVGHFYCDYCYDEFIEAWPLAYSARDAEFQCAGTSLSAFFSGSRLRTIFSEDDFERLIAQLDCPNCGSTLAGNIWPYHLPFDIPSGFDSHVEEIAKLASKAPFLLLTHPLCIRVFELVKRLAAKTSKKQIAEQLYRARHIGKGVDKSISCFDFPPAQYVAEGRYNHAGRPALYVGSTPELCLAELRGADCLIMGFQLKASIRILDLVDPDAYGEEDQELLSALCFSALTSSPANGKGWEKPAYVFTRFIADCAAFYGFDAIKYPSTRLSEQDGSFNLVILTNGLSLAKQALSPEFFELTSGASSD